MSRIVQLVLLGAGMCLLAGAFGVPALLVPGVTLLLVAASAAACVSGAARRAVVELELSAERAEEGEDVTLRATAGGRLSWCCRGELRALPQDAPVPVAWRARSVARRVRGARRGRLAVGPASASWSDPFQLCRRERQSSSRELLILPRVHRLARQHVERILSLPDAALPAEAPLDPDGLRRYTPGSPASRIHWLTLARSGVAMERVFCEDARPAPAMVVLDASEPASRDALDMAVRAAASLCLALAGAGGCALLLPGRLRTDTLGRDLSGWERLHERLALVEAGESPRWELARACARVVLVQARAPQAPPGLPVGCCVSPLPVADAPVLFDVAGCSVQTLNAARAGRAA